MNPYVEEAVYCLRRASRAMNERMSRDEMCDAVIYFGFGVEKALKAILYSVNPIFLLEDPKIENAIAVLYRDRLTTAVQGQLHRDKAGNASLIPFQPSLVRAGKFCRSVLDNTGALTQVAELRGIAAHRIVADLDVAETSKFLLKTFHPTVLVFADAVGFDAADCYDDREKMGSLSLASERLHDPEKLVAEMTRLLAKHRAIWEARKDDPEDIAYNRRLTQEMLDEQARGMPRGHATACEACAQTAVLLYHFEDRFDHDASEICTIGVFAVGQICYFCDLQLTTYEQIDYFKLNQKIAQAYSSPFRRR